MFNTLLSSRIYRCGGACASYGTRTVRFNRADYASYYLCVAALMLAYCSLACVGGRQPAQTMQTPNEQAQKLEPKK